MKDNIIGPLVSKSPWIDNDNMIWLASTATLNRNIEKFKFPNKLDNERRKQMIQQLNKEIVGLTEIKKPQLLKAEELNSIDKEYLTEHYFQTENYQQSVQGEGFIIDETGNFFASLNIGDHVRLHYLDCKEEMEQSWAHLMKIETALGKSVSYAYSSRFGFLTSDPTECGTAFIVNAFIQVPALIHTGKLDDFLEKNNDESVICLGMQGTEDDFIGDIINLRNNFTLGVNEEGILGSVRSYANRLVEEEKNAREIIRNQESAQIKDKVSRAFAVLIHSYQIEAIEALNAISLLKLGVDFGWVTGINVSKLNNLFFNCRRAHLLTNFKEKITQDEIPHKRAEFIHKYLKDVKLTI